MMHAQGFQEIAENSKSLGTPYGETFKDRQVTEQYYSRLGDREVEQTTHYGFAAISNQMTIAHLSASLIAVAAAVILQQPDKIRCYRTFAHLLKTG